jgi:hypothetical protein
MDRSFALTTGGLVRIQRCGVAFALLDVPRETRAANCLRERAVSFLSRAARASFSGSLLRGAVKSGLVQPRCWNSSAMVRSARACAPASFKAPEKEIRAGMTFLRAWFGAEVRGEGAANGTRGRVRSPNRTGDSARIYRPVPSRLLPEDCFASSGAKWRSRFWTFRGKRARQLV